MKTYETISQIKQADREQGGCWFDASSVRFFKSLVYPQVYAGRYFISSEKYDNDPRAYTVRFIDMFGRIRNVGEFQKHATKAQAIKAMWKHANEACDCGHLPSTENKNYGGCTRDEDDHTVCYKCADEIQINEVKNTPPGDVHGGLYVSMDGNTITTWTGGRLMQITHWGSAHNNSYLRRYLSAKDDFGNVWWGTGENGQYALLRKSKAKNA